MKHLFLPALSTFLLLCALNCATPAPKGGPTDPPMSMGDNSQNSLDWPGTYTGTLPCADCEGMKTRLTLREDKTFSYQTVYLGKSDSVFTEEGTFTWNKDGGRIMLMDRRNNIEKPLQYRVGENRLTQLDMDGKLITGSLADRYNLEKMTEMTLTGTKWQLTELNGKKITEADYARERPYLEFQEADGRVGGYAGCNNMFGSYETMDGMRITFSQLGMTKMACQRGMDTESRLSEVLNTADNYSLSGTTLTLNKARMAPLARFEAAME
ncbi:MAG: copper resistance protein NlpE N-terminal domain-containing protein [Saprospiraceae bacterium]